jgi:hypothetical protein
LGIPFFAFVGLWLAVLESAPLMSFATVRVFVGLANGITTAFELTVLSACYRELTSRAAA